MRATYYRHSCMLDNIRSDDESEDYVDFQVVDAEDDEDEVNHRAMSIFDLNEDESDEEQSSDNDGYPDSESGYDDDFSTPTFDASFEPVGNINNLSDFDFRQGILNDKGDWLFAGCHWVGGADGKLKRDMYAFLVTQMK